MGFEVDEDLVDPLDGLAGGFAGFEARDFLAYEVDEGGFVRFFHVVF